MIAVQKLVEEGEIGKLKKVHVYCDGASRGNPGPASYGFAVVDPEIAFPDEYDFCYKEAGYIGFETNNVAEYMGVVSALDLLRENGVKEVTIRSDSQLLVRQLQGVYKVKAEGLIELFKQAQALVKNFKKCQFEHIPREENTIADHLANRALNLLK